MKSWLLIAWDLLRVAVRLAGWAVVALALAHVLGWVDVALYIDRPDRTQPIRLIEVQAALP